jgi:8-oxo-dGTP diphosphatase
LYSPSCYYEAMNEPSFYRVSVKGIVVDETGRFLLSREDNGNWDMIGGGLDHGEDPIEGLRREIREETGLEVTYISSTPKYFITGPRLGHETFMANIVYEIKLESLNFIPSDECLELKFFNVEEAQKIKVFPTIKKLLEVFNPELHV